MQAMNASLATADRGTYLKTTFVACLFSLVALMLATNLTNHQSKGPASLPDNPQIATHGSTERFCVPSTPRTAMAFAAMSLPGDAM